MESAWVESHLEQVQRLVTAFLKTLVYIQTHSADEIAARMPTDYFAGDRELYVRALAGNKGMFTPMIVLAVVALLAEFLLTQLENRLLKWRPFQVSELDRLQPPL